MTGATILILGCGDIGSAVAHRLFLRGTRVLLCDRRRPAHARRGMAFTDALFDGSTTLDGVVARFAEHAAAVEQVWSRGDAVPVTAMVEQEILHAFPFDVAIDATMRRIFPRQDFRAMATTTIGLGPGFTPGSNCHVAIETNWGDSMGAVVTDHSTQQRGGGPARLADKGRERFVAAPASGTWRTTARIGQQVAANEEVGSVDAVAVRVPFGGTLRGLTHDSVEIKPGEILIEVDPRQPPQVFGLGERPSAIAQGVCIALGLA